jgi:2-methylfumaryl-CoA hydratase
VGDTIEVETKVLNVRPSSSRPNLGIVSVQSTARKDDGSVVMTWQRKVQVYKRDADAELHPGEAEPDVIDCDLWLPTYDAGAGYAEMAHLSSSDSYFEDFEPATLIEHSRGRTVTDEHIQMTAMLDNTSQVHCNQYMIDLDPKQYVGGRLIIFGGIPFTLCLGLSSPDVGDNALGDVRYATGRHTAPLFAGDTVFASTLVRGKHDYPGRDDLGLLETTLLGHKFVREEGAENDDAPPGWQRVAIFELEREIAVKRRSHYAS